MKMAGLSGVSTHDWTVLKVVAIKRYKWGDVGPSRPLASKSDEF